MDKVYVGNIVKFEHEGKQVTGIVYEADYSTSRVQTLRVVDGQVQRVKIKGIWNKDLNEATPEDLKAYIAGIADAHAGIDQQIATIEAAIKEMKEKLTALKAQKKSPNVTLEVPEFTPEIIVAEETAEHGHLVQHNWDHKEPEDGEDDPDNDE